MEEKKNLEPQLQEQAAEQVEVQPAEEVQTDEVVEQTATEPQPAEEQVEAQPTEEAQPAEEVKPAEEAQPAEEKAEEVVAPVKVKKAKKKKKGIGFWKVFLATLLALVVYGVIKLIFWGGVIAALFAEPAVVVPEKAILKIDFAENLTDAPSRDPMASFDFATMSMTPELTIFEAIRAIDVAATDDRIQGIYLNLTGMGTYSVTSLEELRESITRFKASGKFVVAYNENYDQWSYYLCSVADEVYMHPEGTFSWTGVAANTMFYTGLIEKLDIGIDILRPTECKYKSAVEPFFRKELSPENREQMQAMVDNIWNIVTTSVSTARQIPVEQLNKYADELSVVLPEEAVEHKMVDGVKYADQMEQYFIDKIGVGNEAMISLGSYAMTVGPDPEKADAPKVAIIYANGNVVDGDGYDNAIYSYSLSRVLKQAREDETVSAVVLRINSPGGSALAADLIWREASLLQQTKPVVVSMGEYAASGGYYIAAPADAIFANRMTLTGSIGVFGIIPSFGDALKENLGISIDGVKTNANSEMGQGFKTLNQTERAALMRSVDRVYDRFTSLVAEGRNLTQEQVFEIAEGRVWLGTQASEIGLVDSCGGLLSAIAYAKDMAGMGENYQVVELYDIQDEFAALMNSLSAEAKQELYEAMHIDGAMQELEGIKSILTTQGVYTYCPYNIEFK